MGRYASSPAQISPIRYGRGESRPNPASLNLVIGMPAARLAPQKQLLVALRVRLSAVSAPPPESAGLIYSSADVIKTVSTALPRSRRFELRVFVNPLQDGPRHLSISVFSWGDLANSPGRCVFSYAAKNK